MRIADRTVGGGTPTFIIAEIGINHNGDPELAREMISAAAEAGADAVKFQTYTTESLVAEGNPYFEIFRQAELSELSILRQLQQHATAEGVIFFSSATTEMGLELLEELDLPLFKLSSANLTNVPLLRRAAATAKPIIISSGAATLSEVARADEILRDAGAPDVAVLKCTSIYPCPPELANLAGIETLRATFSGPIGFSDHTQGIVAATAAVALGASIVEKHFTLDKAMEGHDHHFSSDPAEMGAMVAAIREAEQMRGTHQITPVGDEISFRKIGRRYVTSLGNISKGTTITADMLATRRPKDGPGIAPEHVEVVVGRKARNPVPSGHSVKWEDI
jgi:N,N'-diacetyllegionaminate synthase